MAAASFCILACVKKRWTLCLVPCHVHDTFEVIFRSRLDKDDRSGSASAVTMLRCALSISRRCKSPSSVANGRTQEVVIIPMLECVIAKHAAGSWHASVPCSGAQLSPSNHDLKRRAAFRVQQPAD
eukprot:507742-Pelagomonas_calceolata.AAC.11